MKIRRILAICFSATGTTERSLRQILESLRPLNAEETEFLNLADRDADLASLPASGREDLIVVAAPVYFGRIPEIMASKLQNLSAESAPAVAMVVYGNREYDDALLELCDILSQRDCYVAGAGAFLAQHSIFPKVASGRPDASDLAALKDFGDACCRYLRNVADVGRIPRSECRGITPIRNRDPSVRSHRPIPAFAEGAAYARRNVRRELSRHRIPRRPTPGSAYPAAAASVSARAARGAIAE